MRLVYSIVRLRRLPRGAGVGELMPQIVERFFEEIPREGGDQDRTGRHGYKHPHAIGQQRIGHEQAMPEIDAITDHADVGQRTAGEQAAPQV